MSPSLLPQVYTDQRVFVSHAGPQKQFALHLRTRLRHAGVSTFVDARELQPHQQEPADKIMQAACKQAQLVVFVITRDFLRRKATIKELGWALAQRQKQQPLGLAADRQLPQLLTVLYPTSVLRTWRKDAELRQLVAPAEAATQQLPGYAAKLVDDALNDKTVDVGELQDNKLITFLEIYHDTDTAAQAFKDLNMLTKLSVFRLDSVPRGDDLLLAEVCNTVLRVLRPLVQLSMGQLVGLEPQLQRIRAALLQLPGQGVRLHGLYGLGGIGKSTLARQFFEEARTEFTRRAFVNVGQDALAGPALAGKLRDLLQQIEGDMAADSSDAGLRQALHTSFSHGGRLLLVLDDLWSDQQLAALLGCAPNSKVKLPARLMAAGSRVLITARQKNVVTNRADDAAEPQEVQPLPELAARQLLCLHAFEKDTAPPSFSEQHMSAATAICGGLPLTLRLLGGALRPHNTAASWQAVLNTWSTAPGDADDIPLLRKSYEALPSDAHRRMFLDAALLLRGQPQHHLTTLWAAQLQQDDHHSGGTLVCRGTGWRHKVPGSSRPHRTAHHVQRCSVTAAEMLRDLVQRSFVVLKDESGSDGSAGEDQPGAIVRIEMHDRLRDMASVIAEDFGSPARWHLSDMTTDDAPPQGVVYAADRIRCGDAADTLPRFSISEILGQHSGLQVAALPFELLPASTAAPPISHMSHLLYLRLSGAPPTWLGSLQQLAVLDMSGLKTLQQLPDSLGQLHSLKILDLSGCSNLAQLPESSSGLVSLQQLVLSRCRNLIQLPAGIDRWTNLQQLDIDECEKLRHLHDNIGSLYSLERLNMDNCISLYQLPDSIGGLVSLTQLSIDECTSLGQLTQSISNLRRLTQLRLSSCTRLQKLPTGLGDVVKLQRLYLRGYLKLPSMPDNMSQLTHLRLDVSNNAQLKELPLSDGGSNAAWRGLRGLDLSNCSELEQLPDSISCLSMLQHLDMSGCSSLRQLPGSFSRLPLEQLDISGCPALGELDLCKMSSLYQLEVSNMSGLLSLYLRQCCSITMLPDGIGSLERLAQLDLSGCGKLQQLPDSIGRLSRLTMLDLDGCKALQLLPDSICSLKCLTMLHLGGCCALQHLPERIGSLGGALSALYLGGCESLQSLPDSISGLGGLQHLDLGLCIMLKALPDSIGSLGNLHHLDLSVCVMLEKLPDSIGDLCSLQHLDLSICSTLKTLPDSIGGLNSLDRLYLRDCITLKQLPDSVSRLFMLTQLHVSDELARVQLPKSIVDWPHASKLAVVKHRP